MINPNIPWPQFKKFCSTRKLDILYLEYPTEYILGASDNSFEVRCLLFRDAGADVLDFEKNYKPYANPEKSDKVHLV